MSVLKMNWILLLICFCFPKLKALTNCVKNVKFSTNYVFCMDYNCLLYSNLKTSNKNPQIQINDKVVNPERFYNEQQPHHFIFPLYLLEPALCLVQVFNNKTLYYDWIIAAELPKAQIDGCTKSILYLPEYLKTIYPHANDPLPPIVEMDFIIPEDSVNEFVVKAVEAFALKHLENMTADDKVFARQARPSLFDSVFLFLYKTVNEPLKIENEDKSTTIDLENTGNSAIIIFSGASIWTFNVTQMVNIVSFKLMTGATEDTSFNPPITINFKTFALSDSISEGNSFAISKHNLFVPQGYSSMPPSDIDAYIHVHKFKAYLGETITLSFDDLTPKTNIKIILIFNKNPTAKDIDANGTKISKKHLDISFTNNDQINNEGNGYLGVMANLDTNSEEATIAYSFKVIGMRCAGYDETKKIWKTVCPIEGKLPNLKCTCSSPQHLTVKAFEKAYTTVTLQSEYFELVLDAQFVIFVTSASILFLFCIILIFTAVRSPKDLYYLSDNVISDRYCYLIIVRTNGKRNSGTTSNVMIQIFGKRWFSRKHVLNYPDPQIRLLQRDGEDIFVIATQKHLGKIKAIDVWYNCQGPSPSWNCKEINIFDMQLKELWRFKVNQNFTILHDVDFMHIPYTEIPEKQTFWQRIKVFNEFHTWHFTNKDQENFSNMKRLTIIISNVMSIQVLDMISHGLPRFEMNDSLDYYEYFRIDEYTVYSGVCSAAISFVIHISIAWVFRRSCIRFPRYSQEHLKFSYRYTVGCWIILIIIIVTSTSLLITFGFWVPYYSSLVWLTSSTIAVLNDVFIYENLFILARSKLAKITLIHDIEQHFDKIVQAIEYQRINFHKKMGKELLRPFIHQFYRKLPKKLIKEKKIFVQKRKIIVDELEDLLIFGFYIILVFVVIFTNRAPYTLVVKQSLEDLVNGAFTHTFNFEEINSYIDWYDYVEDTLISILYPTIWKYQKPIADKIMLDANTKLLGVPRIRQYRVHPQTCEPPEILSFLNMDCLAPYNFEEREERDFRSSWSVAEQVSLKFRTTSIWRYAMEEETEAKTTSGAMSQYPGSCYVAFLDTEKNTSTAIFEEIAEKVWIDRCTRAIIIEFLTYNANANVFSSVKLMCELSAVGYIKAQTEVITEKMLYSASGYTDMSFLLFVLYGIIVFIVFIKQSVHMIRFRRTFYKNVWFMMDLILNLVSIACISMFAIRYILIEDYVKRLARSHYKNYVSYGKLFLLEEIMTLLQAFLVTVGTIRVWRYLRFNRLFVIMERTLILACTGLWGATLGFSFILVAFGVCGILIFGNDFNEFQSMLDITRTLITMCLKPDQFQIMDFIEHSIAYAYFTSYLTLMQINMVIYVVVVVIAYAEAQLQLSEQSDNYNVLHYIYDQSKLFPNVLRRQFLRLRGGEDDDTGKVTPKSDEFMYADSVSTESQTMATMYATARSCLVNYNNAGKKKKENHLTDDDFRRMSLIAQYVINDTSSNEDVTVFFKGRIEGQKVQLIDERRLQLIAKMSEFMLEGEENRPHRTDAKKEAEKELLKKCSFCLRRQRRAAISANLRLRILLHKCRLVELI